MAESEKPKPFRDDLEKRIVMPQQEIDDLEWTWGIGDLDRALQNLELERRAQSQKIAELEQDLVEIVKLCADAMGYGWSVIGATVYCTATGIDKFIYDPLHNDKQKQALRDISSRIESLQRDAYARGVLDGKQMMALDKLHRHCMKQFAADAHSIANLGGEVNRLQSQLAAAIEECARACERTAEAILLEPMHFDLTLQERLSGHFVLWGQRMDGYVKKEQLLNMAKILRGMQ